MNNSSCCMIDILMAINALQNGAEQACDMPNTCDKPFLGNTNNNSFIYNTRPITLYNSNNTLIEAPYTLNDTESTSSVFRVEKIGNGTVTLMVLAPNPDTTSDLPYVKTDSFIIVNTNCICAIQCLTDTFIDCI